MSLFVLSLSHLSANTIAKVLWTTPSMKEFMKTTFIYDNAVELFEILWETPEDEKIKNFEIQKKFYAEAYQQLRTLCLSLPSAIQRQIGHSVRVFGNNIFVSLVGILKMIHALGDSLINRMENFIDNICFTYCGMVDTSATFKNLYCAKPRVVNYYMWTLACELCLEEYILQWYPQSDRRNESTRVVKWIFNDIELEKNSDVASQQLVWQEYLLSTIRVQQYCYSYYDIFLMYWKLWKSKDQTIADWRAFLSFFKAEAFRFRDYARIVDPSHSIEENMFRVSVLIGRFEAMKYFWNKLNTEMKSRQMRKLINHACWFAWEVRGINFDLAQRRDMKRQQYFNIICFLIKNVTQSQLDQFFIFASDVHYSRYQRGTIRTLPLVMLLNQAMYPEFCLKIVPRALEHLGKEPWTPRYADMVHLLLRTLHNESKLHGEDIFNIGFELWTLGPVDSDSKLRNSLLWESLGHEECACKGVLSRIINDPRSPKFVDVPGIKKMWVELNERGDRERRDMSRMSMLMGE